MEALQTEARQGNWPWALFAGALLLVMEFLLLTALVPGAWAERVRGREAAGLEARLGADTLRVVRGRADAWYGRLFVAPGLEAGSYRILLPGAEDAARSPTLAPLARLRLWDWLEERLNVIWATLHQALLRLALLLAWWPFLGLVLLSGAGEGLVRRRLRQASFAYPSPLAHRTALYGLLGLLLTALAGLFLPVPLPVFGVPVLGVLAGLCLAVALANTQKRL